MTGQGAATQCETWRDIIEVARRAPSPHNVQPWRIQLVSPDEAELFIDGARTLPNEDLTGSFLLSAMGLFIEAIACLAALRSLRLVVAQHRPAGEMAAMLSRPATPGLVAFARLTLVPGAGAEAACEEALFMARRTSRLPFRPDPIAAPAVARLASLSAPWGHSYAHVSEPALVERIIACNVDAVFHDMNVPAYHDEIAAWFRFTHGQVEAAGDGLDWRCMNVPRAEFWLSARCPGVLQAPVARGVLKRRYRRQLGHAPAIGVLSGDFFDAGAAVHAGRFLMRFWLEAAQLGLSIHPYGNLVTNPDAAAWFRRHVGVAGAWLIFKIGHSDPAPLSARRSLDDILVGNAA